MTALKTFCDIDNNIVGYAISAVTSSVDPVTCVASFGLQAEYYDTDFNVLGSSLPAGWGECCCGGSETVTTLIETPANKTATYTNEIGATTVLSETDFTANSQIIPGTCEGVLDDADVKRELPVRWDTVSNTYKAYDDGKNTALTFQSPWNGTDKPSGGVNTPTGYTWTTPISSIVINNPSACRPMVLYNNLLKAMSVNSNDSAGLPRVTFTGFQDNGSGTFAVASVNVLSSQVNAVGQIDDTVLSFLYPMALNTIPAGASITLRSYQDAVYTQGNSAGGASNASSGFGQIQGIGVVQ